MKPASQDAPATFHPASSLDFVPREHLRRLQSERLREAVGRAFENVAPFRQRMNKAGLTPAAIHGIDDVHKLPLTNRSDLEDAYPFGMLAVPLQQVARLYSAGSAPGKPFVVAFTRRDVDAWTEVVVRALASCGFHQGDVIQNACGHELLADGQGLHDGAEALGAAVIPCSAGDFTRRIAILKDLGVSAVCSTASSFLQIVDRAEKVEFQLRELPLRIGAFVGEPWSETVRQRIEQSAGLKAFQVYGPTELIGPGVAAECFHQSGLHVFEDHFYPEIVDPESGEPSADGQEGELVLTALGRQAMPLIRYRTGEWAAMVAEPCPCGRTLRRIRRIGKGRRPKVGLDDVVVIEGVSVAAAQIEAAILAVEGTLPPYQIVLSEQGGLDHLAVEIEVTPQVFSDRVGAMESLQARLAEEIGQTVGIHATVRLVEPRTIERSQGETKKVVDKRSEGRPESP